MAITNVISNTDKVFKDIIVINRTDKNLKKLHLSYDGVDRSVLKISDLPKGQQIKKSLLIDYLTQPTKLMLIYNSGEEEKKILAYDSISHDDLSTLTLIIKGSDNNLIVDSCDIYSDSTIS